MAGAKDTDDLAVQVAWLSYIGGYTQADIASRLSLSRAKVHRLISEAHAAGYVHVFIDRSPARLVALEDRVRDAFGLRQCTVVPDISDHEDRAPNVAAVGAAAARYLHGRFASGDIASLGLSWGRALSEMTRQLPRGQYSDLALVSLMGSLTLQSAINPFDVVYRLADITGGQGFFLPAPFMADSVEDKSVLVAQRSVSDALERARGVDLCCVGIGALLKEQPMFAQAVGLLGESDLADLQAAGAEGELLGHFLDSSGRLVDSPTNNRTIGLSLDELKGLDVMGVAAGEHKAPALIAVLNSGVLDYLIIDERAADAVCLLMDKAG
ncbi:sugar-binding transcriptional regulator [Salinisphaera aquimarina]|uniref:Sugar-binding transcriptional regulator n=1 Tax=Salinisphaera aquimarina TaxID=2094031 RepID=A0ABV7EPK4_9GAMM